MERSAQCRSSITSSSGASSDRRTSSDSTPSNSWTRSKPSPGAAALAAASSGSSRPRLGTAAASGAATSASPGRRRGRGRRRRRARTGGHVAHLHAAADQHPDAAASARAASSSSSRVLPTPASPAISPTAGRRARPGRAGRPGGRAPRPGRRSCWRVEVTPESMARRPTVGHAGIRSHLRTRPPCMTKGRRRAAPGRRAGRRARRWRRRSGRGQGADPVLPAEQLGGDHGGRADGRHRGHPVADHVGQLPGVPAVRVDAAVGAVGDPHPGLDRLGEAVALGLGGGLVLGQRLGRPALPRPLGGDVVAVVDVGHQVGPLLGQQVDRLVVQQRAVLDGAGAGPGGVADALGAVGVGGHMGALGGRLSTRRAQLLLGQLGGARPGPEGEHGPGGDHLDEVGAAVQDRPHPLADLGRGGDLAEAEVAAARRRGPGRRRRRPPGR